VIDLHLHTTASDGLLSPDALVAEAVAAGLTTIAVTDHDTVAGLPAATAAARAAGIVCVPGIEITAVHEGTDVHVLGYFFDVDSRELHDFLTRQLDDRRRRVIEITSRLADLGVPIDVGRLDTAAHRESRRSLGRPMIARALVEAGHVANVQEAFDTYLATGRPAFMPRVGMTPPDVFALIARAGGLASLAHPVKLDEPTMMALVDAGVPAIEVYHPDHNAKVTSSFREIAARRGLLVTGGSDFHGSASGRTNALGKVVLPKEDYERTASAAGWSTRS
jgi:predicted metal-dependent phosphoesterase TrpH